MERLWRFLQESELPLNSVTRIPKDPSRSVNGGYAISIEGGNFSWNPKTAMPHTLMGVNLHVKMGWRVAVCGMVGSGKSSLLSCILGEMPVLSGTVRPTEPM